MVAGDAVAPGVSVTLRTRLLKMSPTYKSPELVTTTPVGLAKLADSAGPPSPANANLPLPANVSMIPVAAFTRRITWLPESEMKRFPAAFTDTRSAYAIVADVAGPPSPE